MAGRNNQLSGAKRQVLDRATAELRYQPLVVVVAAVAAGIVLDRYLTFGAVDGGAGGGSRPIALLACWCAALFCVGVWWWFRRSKKNWIAAYVLLVAVSLAGAAWHDVRWFVFPASDIGRYAPIDAGPTCVTATVIRTPEILPAVPPTPLRAIPGNLRSRVEVEATEIRDGEDWLATGGRCELLVDGELLGVHDGDTIRVFGQLERPSPPANPGEFDFAASARAER